MQSTPKSFLIILKLTSSAPELLFIFSEKNAFFNPNLGEFFKGLFWGGVRGGGGGGGVKSPPCLKLIRIMLESLLKLNLHTKLYVSLVSENIPFSTKAFLILPINESISFANYASRIRLSDCSKLTINQKNDNDITIFRHDAIVKFFEVVLFLLSSLVTIPSFISISSLVLL